jgi:hypothetical protein
MGKSNADDFYLIPKVKELQLRDGFLKVAQETPVDFVTVKGLSGPDERYFLTVSADGVEIVSSTRQGFYRGGTTLKQLLLNCPDELPCMKINDWPDFPARGFYHDVTRGRVPTIDTLKRLADTLAFYKINQLQLYIEHAFAFRGMAELWEGKDPLRADHIRELDEYCAARFIDLVPSLSTFGHLYELLRLPRFERLNELDIKASQIPRCLWDRMAHYTLDVGNPQSFELVKGMIEEYLPLFSSQYFNICCDETFDLGKGKNAARAEREGGGRLYVDFVKKIAGVVKSMGKKPMMWGDIVLKHPELISELAGDDAIFLNWDYTPDVSDAAVKTFAGAGVSQYVCPGVNGWSRFAADVNRACSNISRMARYGKAAVAQGVLNTDWGDCGQVNLLSSSYHGLAFGAALSWDVSDGGDYGNDDKNSMNSNDDKNDMNTVGELCSPDGYAGNINDNDCAYFDKRFTLLQWGIDDDKLGKILRELGELSGYHFGNLYAWINNKQCLWFKEDDVKAYDCKELARKAARAGEIKTELEAIASKIADTRKKDEFEEYIWSALATGWLLSLLLYKKKYEYHQEISDADISVITTKQLVKDGTAVLNRFKTLWRARNRESELRDVVETFEKILQWIDSTK